MAMSAVPPTRYSLQEYLATERLRDFKSECCDGNLFAMAGATENHNLINANLIRVLGQQLLDRPCKAYPSDMRVLVQATGLCTYPDVSVVCGSAQFLDDVRDTLLNPTVIIEVLSASTESYDRGKKFEHYRKIESLQDYVPVSQDHMLIECFSRQADGRWVLAEASAPEESLRLASIDWDLPVAEVYTKVEFAAEEGAA